jgi:hypothetical protein
MDSYRPWFYAAAAYNAVWGLFVAALPNLIFAWCGMAPPNYPWLMQCVGMVVGVYAIGYWLVARDPVRFGPFVFVGLAGKILGPIGMLITASRGEMPWSFGWLNLANDLIWLPAFIGFARLVWRHERSHHPRNPAP